MSSLSYTIEMEDHRMKTKSVGELKTNFSEVLENVKKGESIVISYGRKKEKIAVIIPYSSYKSIKKRKLGIYEDKATYKIHDDFNLTDRQFLQS